MSRSRDAQRARLNALDAVGGSHWWLLDQGRLELERGAILADRHDCQWHSFYMSVAAA